MNKNTVDKTDPSENSEKEERLKFSSIEEYQKYELERAVRDFVYTYGHLPHQIIVEQPNVEHDMSEKSKDSHENNVEEKDQIEYRDSNFNIIDVGEFDGKKYAKPKLNNKVLKKE